MNDIFIFVKIIQIAKIKKNQGQFMNGSYAKQIQSIKYLFTISMNITVLISYISFQIPTQFLFSFKKNE